MNTELRQTGRTTRMLEQAIQLALSMKSVYVLMHTGAEVIKAQKQIDHMWQMHGRRGAHGIKVEVYSDGWKEQFNWEEFKARGAHHTVEILIDHFLIERELTARREALRRHMDDFALLNMKLYPKTL